jgi:hypothetical protein
MTTINTIAMGLWAPGKGSVVNRKRAELAAASAFAAAVADGANPHEMGAWSGLTNRPDCGGLKSRMARAVCHSALARAGWVFCVQLGSRDFDGATPSAWGLIRRELAGDWSATGRTLDQAAERVGGWKAYQDSNW